MAICHGCVGVEQHKPHRAADDVAASDYDAVFAVGRNAVFVQHIHYPGRRTRHKRTLARDHAADVYRVEGVHVLFRRDRVYHRTLGYLLRQRKLHENSINAVVGVERRDKPQKLCLRRCGREVISAAVYAALEAVALLIAHIYLRCRVVSYQHRRKAGPAAHRRRLAFHLLAELLRELFSVYQNSHIFSSALAHSLYVYCVNPVRNNGGNHAVPHSGRLCYISANFICTM